MVKSTDLNIIACIPAYNEENTIEQIVKKCLEYVNKVVVLDDGSKDNTSVIAKKAGATVLKHSKNLGKGAALRSLFEYTKSEDEVIVVTIDGDGQFLPEEIPLLITNMEKNNSDIVIGYRFENSAEMPKYRKIGNKFFDKMTKMAADLPIRDSQSGFRAYSNNVIKKMDFKSNGFGSDSEILIGAAKKGFKITEEKVSVIYDTGYKTSTENPISHSIHIFLTLIEFVVLKRPMTVIGLPGLILILIGIFVTSNVVESFNDTRYFSIPLTLIAIGTLVIGIFTFLVSIILFSISKLMENKK